MARDAEEAPYAPSLRQKLVSWAYIASRPGISITFSCCLEVARVVICSCMAGNISAWSLWLHPTSHLIALLRPLYILAVLEAILSPVSTVAFGIVIFRRETTVAQDILFFGLIAISTMVAAVVLALQTLVLSSSLDVQAIRRVRPYISSGDALAAWDSFVGGKLPLVAFILFAVADGYQIVAVSARHLVPSSKRLPKQIPPFVIEKQGRTAIVREAEANTQGIQIVAGVDFGPLARLFDDYEKQGLISTHIDLEVRRSSTPQFP